MIVRGRLTPNSRFLLLGRAGMDLYADPPGAKAEGAEKFAAALGGSAGNIAAGLAKQGLSASLLTCVSNDSVGRFVLKQLAAYGVDAGHVHVLEGESRTSLAVTETRIEDTQNTIYRNNASDLQFGVGHIASVSFEDYDALIVTGTALAVEPSRAATFLAMAKARDCGALVVIDLDYRPYSWTSAEEAAQAYRAAIEQADYVVGNDDEFAVVANGDRDAGLDFASGLGHAGRTAIYKMGEKGSVVFGPDMSFETGIFAVEALKPMGAGDAFLALVMATLAAGLSLEEAVRRGSAAAALVVSRFGCAPAMPAPAELEAFLAAHAGTHTAGQAAG